jgi:N-methylhydantoinase A
LILGTTVATNALIQRTGARVIYLTTQGFEDILYIQRMNRRYHYSFEWTKPVPFVERRNCLGLQERVNAKGEVLVPLASDHLDELAQKIEKRLDWYRGEDVAIAICLLFSYLNPEHELRLEEYLKSRFPAIPVSVSHKVAPIWREYERGSTVVADAYIKPILQQYVSGVRQSMDSLELQCPWAIMKSNGGHASARAVETQPVNILLSGLSGGIIGGKYFGELVKEQNLVTLDMGGTSCDVGVASAPGAEVSPGSTRGASCA